MSETMPTGLMEIQRRMAAAVMHPLTRDETMPRRRRDGTQGDGGCSNERHTGREGRTNG